MLTHKNLDVWKRSIDLVEVVYRTTRNFPEDEKYLLTSQMRRAAISIPSNIAEGYARKNIRELIQSFYISLGSDSELETQSIIAQRLDYVDSAIIEDITEEVRRKLLNLIKYHRSKI